MLRWRHQLGGSCSYERIWTRSGFPGTFCSWSQEWWRKCTLPLISRWLKTPGNNTAAAQSVPRKPEKSCIREQGDIIWTNRGWFKINDSPLDPNGHLPQWKGRPGRWRRSWANSLTLRSRRRPAGLSGWRAQWSRCLSLHLQRRRTHVTSQQQQQQQLREWKRTNSPFAHLGLNRSWE